MISNIRNLVIRILMDLTQTKSMVKAKQWTLCQANLLMDSTMEIKLGMTKIKLL